MKLLRSTSTKNVLSLGIAMLSLVLIFPNVASARTVPPAPQNDLADVRWATAQFHRVEAAIEAGYELGYVRGDGTRIITGCISHPTAGAMGYHYFHQGLVDDMEVDPLRPEGLVYAPGPNGQLQLVAVEYVVPGPDSNPPGPPDVTPSVMGMPMHILVPAVGWYILHAWVWRDNPTGMFMDWNPKVVCPE